MTSDGITFISYFIKFGKMFQILESGTCSQHRDFTSLFFQLKVRKRIKMHLQVCDVHTELHEKAYFYVWNDACDVVRRTYKQIHSALTGFSVVSEAYSLIRGLLNYVVAISNCVTSYGTEV